jgi:hypothetical protein
VCYGVFEAVYELFSTAVQPLLGVWFSMPSVHQRGRVKSAARHPAPLNQAAHTRREPIS